ncbi:MAG: hypothetical protein FJ104_16245, partial [Deltaproteobacteria bacterium]|nr:hypothetical protein [Deltaproteobacteria bacterium]
PIFSSFAPWDFSPRSVARLDAALSVLYGPARRPALGTDPDGLVLLAGAYLGEVFRMAHGSTWEGRLAALDSTLVVGAQGVLHPFRLISERIREGDRIPVAARVHALLPPRSAAASQHRLLPAVEPPVPWAPHSWPRLTDIAELGRSVPLSPIGRFCEERVGIRLDHEAASLAALDAYLELVAPVDSTREADTGWGRRVAVLVGSYVGETLRPLVHGEWLPGADHPEDALGFRLRIGSGAPATPVAQVLERVSGTRTSTLVDYARTLLRRSTLG